MCLVRAGVCRCVVAVYSQGAESGGRAIRVESIGDVVKAGIPERRRNVDDASHVDELTRMLLERVSCEIGQRQCKDRV